MLIVVAFLASKTYAATLTLDRACYRNEMPVSFIANGFSAEGSITLQYRPAGETTFPLGSSTADAAGNATGSFSAFAAGSSGEAQYDVIATDDKTSSLATASFKSVELGVGMNPEQAKSNAAVRFIARGFTESPGATLYAHYAYRQSDVKKQYLKTVALGSLDSCGAVSTNPVQQLPLSAAQPGTYIIQFDTSPTYVYQPTIRPYIERSVFVDPSTVKPKKRCKIVKRGKHKKKVCKKVR